MVTDSPTRGAASTPKTWALSEVSFDSKISPGTVPGPPPVPPGATWVKGTVADLATRADLAAAGSNLEQIFLQITGHGPQFVRQEQD